MLQRNQSQVVGMIVIMIEILALEKLDIQTQMNTNMEYTIKETLRIAQILSSEFDCVPSEVDTAYEFLTDVMGEEIEKDFVEHVVGHYMGYSAYDVDQEIFREYFKEDN